MAASIYTDGAYLEKTGCTWHFEDSAFKARWIARMLARHKGIPLSNVCEIGCGAGGILSELQPLLGEGIMFTGYEISPQAHAMSAKFANSQRRYVLGDSFADSDTYDLVLVMDVVEHVEDCFAFMRNVKNKGRHKLYHIPLDVHASSLLRGINAWDAVGHIHLFTIETALKSIELAGQRVIDWMLSDIAISEPKTARTRLANLIRKPLGKISPVLSARLLGGYSMLILAE